MIDVKTHPDVEGNGSHNDTDGLQELINDAGGALHFPTGAYRITKTLHIRNTTDNRGVTGHHFVGSGMSQRNAGGARAVIVWNGNSTDPMIDYKGTGLVWDGVALFGQRTGGNRAATGILVRKPSGDPLNTGKMWFPAISIDDCGTAIKFDGSGSADSCAFGYLWAHDCDTCVHLDGANATMLTFRYIHPLSCSTVFNVENGGRIYVHSINVVLKKETGEPFPAILDVAGGDLTNSFFHINGLTGDGNVTDYYLLRNDDDGDGLTHVRFTNAHLTIPQVMDQVLIDFNAKIDINRSNSTNGQTVVEMVGCRGLNGAMVGNVVINGVSGKKSRLMVRDSELDDDTQLVVAASSSHYTDNRIKNWLFGSGLEPDKEYP